MSPVYTVSLPTFSVIKMYFVIRDNFDFYGEESGNTGFFYARSNNKTLNLWKETLFHIHNLTYRRKPDQYIFWKVIRKFSSPPVKPLGICSRDEVTYDPSYLVSCYIHPCLAGAGVIRSHDVFVNFQNNLKSFNMTMLMLHVTWKGHSEPKQQLLESEGLWRARRGAGGNWNGTCLPLNASFNGV